MVSLETPICDFDAPAPDFKLLGVDGKHWTRDDCAGPKGLLVMFICNHCPYVRAIQDRLVKDTQTLIELGIGVAGIMSNDTQTYPDDNYENMQRVAREMHYPFPYLLDDTQAVAHAFGAICTPDFFGYNQKLELQYRGRLDASRRDPAPEGSPRELVEAMKQIALTGKGPENQISSMGCSIKWRDTH